MRDLYLVLDVTVSMLVDLWSSEKNYFWFFDSFDLTQIN